MGPLLCLAYGLARHVLGNIWSWAHTILELSRLYQLPTSA